MRLRESGNGGRREGETSRKIGERGGKEGRKRVLKTGETTKNIEQRG